MESLSVDLSELPDSLGIPMDCYVGEGYRRDDMVGYHVVPSSILACNSAILEAQCFSVANPRQQTSST